MIKTDIDKMWVFMEIVPYPRVYCEWEVVFHALSNSNIDYPFRKEHGGDTIMHPSSLDTCIVFQIPCKKTLFLSGEFFEARFCGPLRKKHTIFAGKQFDNFGNIMASSGGCGNDKYTAKIELTLCPPRIDAEKFQQIERRKEAKRRRRQKWQEIVRRCFKPFKGLL